MISLGFDSAAQGANGTECALVPERRTAHRAGWFTLHCRHRILLVTRMLLLWSLMARGKSTVIGLGAKFPNLRGRAAAGSSRCANPTNPTKQQNDVGQNGAILSKQWGPPQMFNPFKKRPFGIDDFAKLVTNEAKKAGIAESAESLEYDPKSFALKRADQRTYLGSLVNDYRQSDDEQKKRILGNTLALLRQKKRDSKIEGLRHRLNPVGCKTRICVVRHVRQTDT
jgi:hypothetical protein